MLLKEKIKLAYVIYLLKAQQDPFWASVISAVDPFVCLSFIFSFLYFHYSILSYQEKMEIHILDKQNTLLHGLILYMVMWMIEVAWYFTLDCLYQLDQH